MFQLFYSPVLLVACVRQQPYRVPTFITHSRE